MSRSTVRVDTSSSSASSLAERRPRCWSSRRSERRRSARTTASIAEIHDTRCRVYARGSPHDNEQRPPPRLPLGPGLGEGEGPSVEPAALDRPTPCSDYDVRALLGHLVATVDRARVIAEGGDPTTMPVVVIGVADDGWPAELAAAVDKAMAAWSDDAVLDREAIVPWGPVPGGRPSGATSTRRWCTGGTSPSPRGSTARPTPRSPKRAWPWGSRSSPRTSAVAPAVRRGRGVDAGRGPDRAARELGGPPPLATGRPVPPHA